MKPSASVNKRKIATVIAEDSAWIKHCNGQYERLTVLLGRPPTDGEWLDKFAYLVDQWAFVPNNRG